MIHRGNKMNLQQRRLVFSLVTLTFWMPPYFYVQILPAYIRRLGGSLSMIGLISGAYGLTQALFRIPIGVMADNIGRKKPFVILGVLASVVSGLLFIWAKSPLTLLWARAFAGVSSATWVVLTILIVAYYPQKKVTAVMGMLYALSNMGQLLASLSGAFMAELWGWKAPFVAALISSFLALFFLGLMEKEIKAPAQKFNWRILALVGTEYWVVLASILGLLIHYGSWSLLSFSPIFAVNLGAGKGDLGLLSLFGLVPTILGSFLLRKLLQITKRNSLLLLGFICEAVSLLFLPLAKSFAVLSLLAACGGLGKGIVVPALMGMCQKGVHDSMKTMAMGIFQAVYALGIFLGPAITGIVSDRFGVIITFTALSILMLGSGLVSVAMDREKLY